MPSFANDTSGSKEPMNDTSLNGSIIHKNSSLHG